MTRVFEALERARDEGAQPVTKPIHQEEPQVPGAERGNSHNGGNGWSPPIHGHPQPPWRLQERIEELLFGWHLGKLKAHPLVALEYGSSAAEQYKILREQIRKMCSEGGARFLAVTSPTKGDGKTTIAANLAATLAYEHRVLLIDADLRSPAIHHCFGINSSPGLGDYLSSSSSVEFASCVQDTALPGLRVVAAGKNSVLSSELLATERMKILTREIPSKFPGYQIIFDTSPVLSTPDPLVLSQLVDGILMVIRAGKTPRDCLSQALKLLGSDKIMGVVLNGAEVGRASTYYRHTASAS